MVAERKGGSFDGRFATGCFLLSVAVGAALILVLDRFGAMKAPGCGATSACHSAAAGEFGALPVLRWPLSYAGLAWFTGLFVAWIRTRGAVEKPWKWLAQAGAAGSLFWLGVLAAKGLACPYCIAIHVANLAFVGLLELGSARTVAPARRASTTSIATFAAMGVMLYGLDLAFARAARVDAERELDSSTAALHASQRAPGGAAETAGFSGRHRRGPERARARFVVFTDFQCPECRALEREIEALLARSDDVSLAIRHYPLCSACNAKSPNLHPNACWAARAAEAASDIAGDAGYWRMHRWLFEHSGSFTEVELDHGIKELGFDRAAFLAAMHSATTLERVRADIALGDGFGLTTTPMIFVNGVELRGWNAPGALGRTLAELRAAPISEGNATDRPPSARERHLDVWRTARIETLPTDTAPHVLGPQGARVSVVLFGDYQEPFTCAADVELRALTLRRGDVSYSFRVYPVNRACNPVAEQDLHPLACLAALGAEAICVLQGEDGFWAMHDWIITHRTAFDDASMTHAAEEMGLDRDGFWKAMTTPELPLRVEEDARAAQWLGLKSIPLIFVNGKRVETWKVGDESLLPVIIAEAARN